VKEGETLLQGICVDTGATTVLEKGKKYFLFSNGPGHYYVSRFPGANSHQGCFHKSLFKLVQEDEWPPEPSADNVPVLDSSKVYKARLVWRRSGYKQVKLGTYYLRPLQTHAYFYYDKQLKRFGGCFPLHWFKDFREVNADKNEINEAVLETDEVIFESEALECETKEEQHETFEQICIFDFIDK
jgi:hypothetical protein